MLTNSRPVRFAEVLEDLIFERIEIGNGGLQEGTKLHFVTRVTEEIVLVERGLGVELVDDNIVEFGIYLGQQVRAGLLRKAPLADHLGNESIHIGHGFTLRRTYAPGK